MDLRKFWAFISVYNNTEIFFNMLICTDKAKFILILGVIVSI